MPGPKGEECRLCYFGEVVEESTASEPHEDPEYYESSDVLCRRYPVIRTRNVNHWCGEFKPHPVDVGISKTYTGDDSSDTRKPCIDCQYAVFDRSACDISGEDISKGKHSCGIFKPKLVPKNQDDSRWCT